MFSQFAAADERTVFFAPLVAVEVLSSHVRTCKASDGGAGRGDSGGSNGQVDTEAEVVVRAADLRREVSEMLVRATLTPLDLVRC